MIYELRTYYIPAGRMPDILDRFATVTMRLFTRHGMEVVGFWTVAPPAAENALIYLMRYPDADAQARAWDAFRADPEWVAARQRTEANGPIVERVVSQNLLPTPFSLLQ